MKQTQSFISESFFDNDQIFDIVKKAVFPELNGKKKILLIPPDITRFYSKAGLIAGYIYEHFKDKAQVDIIPALGSHLRMSDEEHEKLFGRVIPPERILHHDWRTDVVSIGKVPAQLVSDVSEGKLCEDINIYLNHLLLDGGYDYILSLGQVVPHEVVGMANYSKNIFVGLGGASMIDATHYLSAIYGMERIMGRDKTPVRQVFDYAENVLRESGVTINYLLTIVSRFGEKNEVNGIFFGSERDVFTQAAKMSQKYNLTLVDKPFKKVVVYLEPEEFRSTWVGNKAVYRTRMAIADGGELIILAPGVRTLGEDETINGLLKKYGYHSTEETLETMSRAEGADLRNNRSVAAHIIHGVSDGRFKITYAFKELDYSLRKASNVNWVEYDEIKEKYDYEKLKDGYNIVDGEEIYYISNPALGLWADSSKF